MSELLFFKEINNIYKALENIQDETLIPFPIQNLILIHSKNKEISLIVRKQKEIDELKKMATFRREFIADVSYELKTPIFSAQGFIHTLLDGAYYDKSVRENFLKKAAKSLDRLDLIVKDLMTITQIEKGEINMCFESFNLIELSKEIIDELEKNAYQKQVKLKLLNSKDEPIYVIVIIGESIK